MKIKEIKTTRYVRALTAASAGRSEILQQWHYEVHNPGWRKNHYCIPQINSQDGYFSFSVVFGGGLAVMDGLAATLNETASG